MYNWNCYSSIPFARIAPGFLNVFAFTLNAKNTFNGIQVKRISRHLDEQHRCVQRHCQGSENCLPVRTEKSDVQWHL